jgi:hypothetical protein
MTTRKALAELAESEAHYRLIFQTAPSADHLDVGRAWDRMRKAGDAAREALAQSEPEPKPGAERCVAPNCICSEIGRKLCEKPSPTPAPKRPALSDERIAEITDAAWIEAETETRSGLEAPETEWSRYGEKIARAIERALRGTP